MRYAIANAIMWLIKPVLGPMMKSLDDNVTQLINRKVERTEVSMAEDGTLRAKDPTTFVHV